MSIGLSVLSQIFVSAPEGPQEWRHCAVRAQAVSIQLEPLPAHEGAEVGALRFGILPRLVHRPAIERGRAEANRHTKTPERPRFGASPIVAVDLRHEIGLGITLLVHGHR